MTGNHVRCQSANPHAECPRPRRLSLTRSPDTLSPVYPDRPIRPLPKNRLRSQLSPEQMVSIKYPPKPASSGLLFNFPFGVTERTSEQRHTVGEKGRRHECHCGATHINDSDDDETEDLGYDHPTYRLASPAADGVHRKMLGRTSAKIPSTPGSIASSTDGYESFENTSNKKKRKIPLSGGPHPSSLSAELANMGISSDKHDSAHSRDSSSPGAGLSGAGRGRYGKLKGRAGERWPSGGAASSAINSYASNLSAKSRGGNWKGDGTRTSVLFPALSHEGC